MKIIFVRHAEPDYEHNTLTKKGFKEARLLAKFYKDLKVDMVLSSPLNRAKYTCDEFMKYHPNNEVIVYDWLKEFDASIDTGYNRNGKTIAWDLLPKEINKHDELYDLSKFKDFEWFKNSDFNEKYAGITSNFDKILEEFGLERFNHIYQVKKETHQTLIVFAHFGLISVLLSYLLNIPFSVFSNQTCILPSGVTTLYTEEREEGYAYFRMCQMGDLSHLLAKKEEPSFAARFCECFNDETRH